MTERKNVLVTRTQRPIQRMRKKKTKRVEKSAVDERDERTKKKKKKKNNVLVEGQTSVLSFVFVQLKQVCYFR